MPVRPLEGHRPGQPAQLQRDDDPAACGELIDPGRGNVPCPGRHNDPVIRRIFLQPVLGVCEHDIHADIPGVRQAPGRSAGHVRVNVDRGDLAGLAGQLRHQRRVVAAGTDLQCTHTRFELSLFRHRRLKPRRGDRAEGSAMLIPLGDRSVVAVCPLQRLSPQEHMLRHRIWRTRYPSSRHRPGDMRVSSCIGAAVRILVRRPWVLPGAVLVPRLAGMTRLAPAARLLISRLSHKGRVITHNAVVQEGIL